MPDPAAVPDASGDAAKAAADAAAKPIVPMSSVADDAKAAADKVTADAAAKTAADAAAKATTDAAAKATADAAAKATPTEYVFPKVEGVPAIVDAETTAQAKALGLTQEQASKLRDANAASYKADVEAIKRESAQRKAEYLAINKSHAEFGGTKFPETQERVNQVLAFAGEHGTALAKFIDAEGVRDLPQIHNFLAHLGYAMAEGKFHAAGAQTPADPNRPATLGELYHTMK